MLGPRGLLAAAGDDREPVVPRTIIEGSAPSPPPPPSLLLATSGAEAWSPAVRTQGRGRSLWGRVRSAIVAPGRWSPRPDNQGHTQQLHVGPIGPDGYPPLADPFGLMDPSERWDDEPSEYEGEVYEGEAYEGEAYEGEVREQWYDEYEQDELAEGAGLQIAGLQGAGLQEAGLQGAGLQEAGLLPAPAPSSARGEDEGEPDQSSDHGEEG